MLSVHRHLYYDSVRGKNVVYTSWAEAALYGLSLMLPSLKCIPTFTKTIIVFVNWKFAKINISILESPDFLNDQ